jgi:hypothetical protein
MRQSIIAFLLLTSISASAKTKFPIDKCDIPYNEEPTQGLIIDRVCGLTGNAHTEAKKAQDQLKNNLCASGSVKTITLPELKELQEKVDASGVQYGHGGPPVDRTAFTSPPELNTGHTFHEGQLVRLVAFVAESHYSPKSASNAGESSNCGLSEHEMVDIHVALAGQPGEIKPKDAQRVAKLCQTVSAEIIPHLRPEAWQNDWIHDVIKLERPVRITGQLFFDGSHHACTGDTAAKGDPQRASGWEIHPVYKIEVCKHPTLAECGGGSGNWQKISDVPELQPEEENDGPQ